MCGIEDELNIDGGKNVLACFLNWGRSPWAPDWELFLASLSATFRNHLAQSE